MHMSDALLSPAIGGSMWAAAGVAVACSARKFGGEVESRKIPLMGVLAAFVFAGQMVNFTIPGVGSSGHLGGGMILAVLLGPSAAFLAMASVLIVQALFFADGGLLALGCNMVNLGFIPAFAAFPLVFRPLAGPRPGPGRLLGASLAASVAGLQLGALAVVLETVLSGVSELPFLSFVLLMLPVHLAIGIVEGLITATVVTFVWKARPGIFLEGDPETSGGVPSLTGLLVAFAVITVVVGGGLSLLASSKPDGLEWAVSRVSGQRELPSPGTEIHGKLGALQEETALLPDYGLPGGEKTEGNTPSELAADTSAAGIIGGLMTLLFALSLGFAAKRVLLRKPA